MPRKKRKPTIQQLLIENFLRDPKAAWRDNRKKAEQLKLATQLSKLYNRNFWEKLYLPFKLNSLAWFKTPNGKDLLSAEYKKLFLKLNEAPEAELGKRVGRNKKINKRKPRTILDFLNEEKEK